METNTTNTNSQLWGYYIDDAGILRRLIKHDNRSLEYQKISGRFNIKVAFKQLDKEVEKLTSWIRHKNLVSDIYSGSISLFRGKVNILSIDCNTYVNFCHVKSMADSMNSKNIGVIDVTSGLPVEDVEATMRDCPKIFNENYQPNIAAIDFEMTSLSAADPESKLYMFSYYSDRDKLLVHTKEYSQEPLRLPGVRTKVVDNEEELCKCVGEIFDALQPDMVAAHNLYYADMPMLYYTLRRSLKSWTRGRSDATGKFVKVNRLDKQGKEHGYCLDVPGVEFIDTLSYITKYEQEERLLGASLNSLSQRHLKDSKDDVPYYEMLRIYNKGSYDDKVKVAKYCLKDSELTLKIFNHFNMYYRLKSMHMLTGVRPQRQLCEGTIPMIVGMISKHCSTLQPRVYLDKSYHFPYQVGGGAVIEPKQGAYKNVVNFDITSMYPSIIKAGKYCVTNVTLDPTENSRLIKKSPYGGDIYMKPSIIEPVIPAVVNSALTERAKIREHMKVIPKDSAKYRQLDAEQLSHKILANAIVGAFAESSPGNPIACHVLNDIVTSQGRMILRSAHKSLLGSGYNVIYGDTDSLFVSDIDDELMESDVLKILHNTSWKDYIHFKKEYKANIFIMSSSKKRYIAYIGDNIKVTGYKSAKSSSCRFVQRTFDTFLELIRSHEITKAIDLINDCGNVEVNDNNYNDFFWDIKLKGSSVSNKSFAAQREANMAIRGVDVYPGAIKEVTYVHTRDSYINTYNKKPPITLPDTFNKAKKSEITYTREELMGHYECINVREILESQLHTWTNDIIESLGKSSQ